MVLDNPRYERVTFLQNLYFDRPTGPVVINPDYRPASPIRLVECIPDPGPNIHNDLWFCPFIWRLSPLEHGFRQHYAILPGVKYVTTERATGWHMCQFGSNPNDGWYYLEHYLAMEARRHLYTPSIGQEDPDRHTAFVVSIRPAFDWAEHYRLSSSGYRPYGLYYRMGTGLGPVLALDGVHEQPTSPGQRYKPDSPQKRLGTGYVAREEAHRPDYRALARDAPFLLPSWRDWSAFHCNLIDVSCQNPGWRGWLKDHLIQRGAEFWAWYRGYQGSLLSEYRDRGIPLLEFPKAAPGTHDLPPSGVDSDANASQAPMPFNQQETILAAQQGPYSQNLVDVHQNAGLQVELSYRQGSGEAAPASEMDPEISPALREIHAADRAQTAVLNDPSIIFIDRRRNSF